MWLLTSGIVDAGQLGDEKCEADADGGEESAFVLLGGKHEDGEDELGGQEHFDDCMALEGGGEWDRKRRTQSTSQ